MRHDNVFQTDGTFYFWNCGDIYHYLIYKVPWISDRWTIPSHESLMIITRIICRELSLAKIKQPCSNHTLNKVQYRLMVVVCSVIISLGLCLVVWLNMSLTGDYVSLFHNNLQSFMIIPKGYCLVLLGPNCPELPWGSF